MTNSNTYTNLQYASLDNDYSDYKFKVRKPKKRKIKWDKKSH